MAQKVSFTLEIVGTDKQIAALNKVEKELKEITKERNLLMKAQEKGKKLTAEETKKLNELTKSQIRDRQEKTRLTKSIKDNLRASEVLKGSYVQISAVLSVNEAKWKRLSQAERENTKAGRQLTATIKKQRAALVKLDSAIGTSSRKVGNYTGALKSAAGALIGGLGVVAGVMAFTRVLKNSIKVVTSFEKTFKNVLTLLSESQKTEFGGILKEGAADIISEFGFSIEDVNKALFDTISAGIPAGDAINFLRKSSILAIGGVTDLKTAVDGVTSVMNAYGLEASEVNKVTAAFFTAQKFGKTTVAELSANIGKAAPIARAASVSYQELLSTFAELTKQGISTEESSTAIRAVITALIKPSREAKEKFDELGISTGLNAVKQQGLFNILQKVSKAAEEDADSLTVLIPNVRALTGITALGTDALIDYEKILSEVNEDFGINSSLTLAYLEQASSFEQKTKELSGAWVGFLLSLDAAESGFGRFIKTGIDNTKGFLRFLSDEKEFFFTWTDGPTWKYIQNEEKKTAATEKESLKRLSVLKSQSADFEKQIRLEGDRLKKLYGDDFTNFNDVLEDKEGAKLKFLFGQAAAIDTEINQLKGVAEANKAIADKKEKDAKKEADREAAIKKVEADKIIADAKEQVDKIIQLRIDQRKREILIAEAEGKDTLELRKLNFEDQLLLLDDHSKAWLDKKAEIRARDAAAEKEAYDKEQELIDKRLLAEFGLKDEEGIVDEATITADMVTLDRERKALLLANTIKFEAEKAAEEAKSLEGRRRKIEQDFANGVIGEAEYNAKIKKLDVDVFTSKLNLASGVSSAIMAISDRESIVFKAAAITQTGINTYKAATAAYASAAEIPVVGWILGPIAAAAATIAGLASVARIAGINFEEGGLIKGKSHSQGGIPFSIGGQGGFEAEGGEIMFSNKAADYWGRSKLLEMNMQGNQFESGGFVASTSQRTQELSDESVDRLINGINNKQVINDPVEALEAQNEAIFIQNNGDI